jgi:molybdopterin synthase catalytic subunit
VRVNVRLFAGLRQLVGGDLEEHFEADTITVAELTRRLAESQPALKPHFEVLAIAVNQEYCTDRAQRLRDGDEVALIQPISGGAPEDGAHATPHYLVTSAALDAPALRALVLTPASGAVVLFEGVVRDRHEGHEVLRLEYEAYEPMAERVMRQVGEAVVRDYDVHDVAIHHRTGMLEIGETSLLVAVSAEHRAQAFEAALAAVDRVKQSVPVWKREYGPNGATWQEGVPPQPVS